ncbi:DUF4157 domain-containing protein [Archangium violaceum]|uniref:eCIS core domain-containing protein n=1 Tax=Archangium violaceum TaxID=83451 RepID=UPI00193C128D|nr:DUF4157 domain-containing protein [Archangium violaceum]QRK12986.1 DUF4157 domain-containing protein [Archangium violaceum]
MRAPFEARFHHDFSRVRVHHDEAAAQSAHELGAFAYTWGHHIVLGESRFAPGTPSRREVLTHELAHVVQQKGVPPRVAGLAPTSPGDSIEREADAAVRAMREGQPIRLTADTSGRLARWASTPPPQITGSIADVTYQVTLRELNGMSMQAMLIRLETYSAEMLSTFMRLVESAGVDAPRMMVAIDTVY